MNACNGVFMASFEGDENALYFFYALKSREKSKRIFFGNVFRANQ